MSGNETEQCLNSCDSSWTVRKIPYYFSETFIAYGRR